MKFLIDNSGPNIGGDGTPDLCFHGVLAIADETLDAQMLLDPLEEQLADSTLTCNFCKEIYRQAFVIVPG